MSKLQIRVTKGVETSDIESDTAVVGPSGECWAWLKVLKHVETTERPTRLGRLR